VLRRPTTSDALNCVRELQPDVVLVDVLLNDDSGIDLAIRIREVLPGSAILLFSGRAEASELLQKVRVEGQAFEIIAKPIHPEELLLTIAHARTGQLPSCAAPRWRLGGLTAHGDVYACFGRRQRLVRDRATGQPSGFGFVEMPKGSEPACQKHHSYRP
jgi:CheY-like chemotaxis protein